MSSLSYLLNQVELSWMNGIVYVSGCKVCRGSIVGIMCLPDSSVISLKAMTILCNKYVIIRAYLHMLTFMFYVLNRRDDYISLNGMLRYT